MSIDFIYHPALVPGEDSPETNTLYFLDSQLLLKQEVIADPLNVTPWTTESIAMEPELQLLLGLCRRPGGCSGGSRQPGYG